MASVKLLAIRAISLRPVSIGMNWTVKNPVGRVSQAASDDPLSDKNDRAYFTRAWLVVAEADEVFQRLCADEHPAIDEKCRRAFGGITVWKLLFDFLECSSLSSAAMPVLKSLRSIRHA